MGLFVGTSGWAYKEWSPALYPAGVPQSRYLEHYARELDACEINATFYRTQSEKAVARWAAATPPHFRFAVKAHRAVTHSAATAPPERLAALLDDWLGSLRPLEHRLGVVLVQVPRHKTADDGHVLVLLRRLGRRAPFAVDFRDGSWDTPAVARAVAEAGGTVCHSDWEGGVPGALPPGPIAYVRLRAENYDPALRRRWRERVVAEAAGRDVFVFTKHKGVAPHDLRGGLGLARWLAAACRPSASGGPRARRANASGARGAPGAEWRAARRTEEDE